MRVVGKQLNVRTVLEGSVRRADNRLRITAQLVNGGDRARDRAAVEDHVPVEWKAPD
jgi:TolB-like protein